MVNEDVLKKFLRRIAKAAIRLLLCFGIAYSIVILLAVVFHHHLLYFPSREMSLSPTAFSMEFEDVWLPTRDGKRINAWYIPKEGSEFTLLFFHGNAGNLENCLQRLRLYHRSGWSVFAVDYHGFGKSEGEPGEANFYLDAEAAWQWLVSEKKIPPGRIVIFGQSMGGGIASWLAERQPDAAAVVLESTFASLAAAAAKHYPYLPTRLIVGNAYDTRSRLPNIKIPLLVVHGRGDAVVPFENGERIFSAFKGKKAFMEIAADHNYGFMLSGQAYPDGLNKYFGELIMTKK